MHVYFYLRGVKQFVNLAKEFLNSQYYKLRIVDEKGEKQIAIAQGVLRESVLGVCEYVIPKEGLAEFLAMMGLAEGNNGVAGDKKVFAKLRLSTLRKIFGAKKIPKKVWEKAKKIQSNVLIDDYERCLMQCPREHTAVHLIGISDDKTGNVSKSGCKGERL